MRTDTQSHSFGGDINKAYKIGNYTDSMSVEVRT